MRQFVLPLALDWVLIYVIPMTCTHCGGRVDETGLHDLSCHRSAWRTLRHNQLNTIIKQSLTSANIPSVLELPGLYRSDGKHPDGMIVTP